MASSFSSTNYTSGTIVILQGQVNYTAWHRNFKVAAEARDLWGLLTGTEVVGNRPTRPQPPTTDTTVSANLRSTDAATIASAQALIRFLLDTYTVSKLEYGFNLSEYEDRAKRGREARQLLVERIVDSLQDLITSTTNPKAAFDQIKAKCKISDARAIELKYGELDAITVHTFTTVSELINKLTSVKSDLEALNDTYSDNALITKILKCLPGPFEPFKRY